MEGWGVNKQTYQIFHTFIKLYTAAVSHIKPLYIFYMLMWISDNRRLEICRGVCTPFFIIVSLAKCFYIQRRLLITTIS